MKFPRRIFLLLVAGVGLAGCGQGGREITELQRKQAAHLASEAEFSMGMRDYARAEPELTKVVALVPDNGVYWISLGTVRKRLGNKGGAKDAFLSALKVYEAEAKKNPAEPEPWFRQIYVLGLLGRVDNARSLVEKMKEKFPAHRLVRIFIEEKQLEQMLADPKFKDVAL